MSIKEILQQEIRSAECIVFVINKIKNHKAEIASVAIGTTFFSTFHGIRSTLKFTFDRSWAYGYELSESVIVKKRWRLNIAAFGGLLD